MSLTQEQLAALVGVRQGPDQRSHLSGRLARTLQRLPARRGKHGLSAAPEAASAGRQRPDRDGGGLRVPAAC